MNYAKATIMQVYMVYETADIQMGINMNERSDHVSQSFPHGV
jgi:hypothetical protein